MSLSQFAPVATSRRMAVNRWLSCLIVVVSLVVAGTLRAESPDDQYLKIMNIVDRAEMSQERGDLETAKAKYLQAQTALLEFKKSYPTYNNKMVTFRLNSVTEKLNGLNKPATATGTETKAGDATAGKTGSSSAGGPKLLSAGAEPRQVLRLHPKAGAKESATLTMNTTMEMPPMLPATKVPAIRIPIDVTVENVAEGGDITMEVVLGEATMEEAGADNPVGAAFKGMLGKFGNDSGTIVMSSRGVGKSANSGKGGADAKGLAQAQEFLGQIFVSLPEEAVGVGAKWEAKQSVKNQGMTIQQTTSFELKSVEGGIVTVATKIVQSGGNQKIESPMAPGMKIDLNKFTGNATGTVALNLDRIFPQSAKTESHTEAHSSVNLGGQKQEMNQKIDVKLTLESK